MSVTQNVSQEPVERPKARTQIASLRSKPMNRQVRLAPDYKSVHQPTYKFNAP